jgi:hypothetical protein
MGYDTYFALHIEVANEHTPAGQARLKEVEDALHERGRDDELARAYAPFGYNDDTMRWYDHDDDCQAFSRQFPDIVLGLRGEGEDSEDLWMKFYHDGEIQGGQAEIIYPRCPFTPSATVTEPVLNIKVLADAVSAYTKRIKEENDA